MSGNAQRKPRQAYGLPRSAVVYSAEKKTIRCMDFFDNSRACCVNRGVELYGHDYLRAKYTAGMKPTCHLFGQHAEKHFMSGWSAAS